MFSVLYKKTNKEANRQTNKLKTEKKDALNITFGHILKTDQTFLSKFYKVNGERRRLSGFSSFQ